MHKIHGVFGAMAIDIFGEWLDIVAVLREAVLSFVLLLILISIQDYCVRDT